MCVCLESMTSKQISSKQRNFSFLDFSKVSRTWLSPERQTAFTRRQWAALTAPPKPLPIHLHGPYSSAFSSRSEKVSWLWGTCYQVPSQRMLVHLPFWTFRVMIPPTANIFWTLLMFRLWQVFYLVAQSSWQPWSRASHFYQPCLPMKQTQDSKYPARNGKFRLGLFNV
jgi:hypothetical protein